MTAYYNEIDPIAAQWLRNLIDAGHIASGVVDTRSIEDVLPSELAGYTQCHFFAGIGGWSLALRNAGWPDDRPVWTGSCPCQPFSAAGKGDGFADERHLWPSWFHLIDQCRPGYLFGEQVASKPVDGWIDLVQADFEGLDYAFACFAYPVASIGAPHIRDRTFWVGESTSVRRQRLREESEYRQPLQADEGLGRLGDADSIRARWIAGTVRGTKAGEGGRRRNHHAVAPGQGILFGMADTDLDRQSSGGLSVRPGRQGEAEAIECWHGQDVRAGTDISFWGNADWILCTDGKWRPVEPGTFPLAHGVSNRVGRLRAYGNAIVPQQAQHFITAYCKAQGITL